MVLFNSITMKTSFAVDAEVQPVLEANPSMESQSIQCSRFVRGDVKVTQVKKERKKRFRHQWRGYRGRVMDAVARSHQKPKFNF